MMAAVATAVGEKRKAPPSHTSGDSFDSMSSRRPPAEKKQKASVGIATDRGGKANQEVRFVYIYKNCVGFDTLETLTCACAVFVRLDA